MAAARMVTSLQQRVPHERAITDCQRQHLARRDTIAVQWVGSRIETSSPPVHPTGFYGNALNGNGLKGSKRL